MTTENTEPVPIESAAVLEFMFRLGQAYLACGEQTAQVELLLRRVATAYGMRRSRVVAFPTAVFISLHDGKEERVTLAEGPTQNLRLDQIADVYELGAQAADGEMPPAAGLKRLYRDLERTAARFGLVGVIVGHTILTVGSLDEQPRARDLGCARNRRRRLERNRRAIARDHLDEPDDDDDRERADERDRRDHEHEPRFP